MKNFFLCNDENGISLNCDLSDYTKALPETIDKHSINNFETEFDKDVSEADKWDYIVSCTSGIISATLNILWVGEFSLSEAKNWGSEKTSEFVFKTAKSCGYKGDDLSDAIRRLEKDFVLPADKLTDEFGGGKQHHLRDFSHHLSPVGLVCSILSQFTKKGYGTDTAGKFIVKDLPVDVVLGHDFVEKIFNGTVMWIFHLISDMAGSSSSAGKGTGIPGPMLSVLKEISTLPFFKNIQLKYKDDQIGLSVFASKLFNGTYFKTETENIRLDLRTEIGVVRELTKQTIPIVLNECIIRTFYSIRRFYLELKEKTFIQ